MRTVLITIFLASTLPCFSQCRWHPYGGIHISMNSDIYYAGPSYQLGTDYTLKKGWALSLYGHYFPESADVKNSDGSSEKGKYRSAAIVLLVQKKFLPRKPGGWFLGGGIAGHKYTDDYVSSSFETHDSYKIITLSTRVGYIFQAGDHALTFELNAIGPHIGETGPPPYYEQLIEILTQLSFGIRYIF